MEEEKFLNDALMATAQVKTSVAVLLVDIDRLKRKHQIKTDYRFTLRSVCSTNAGEGKSNKSIETETGNRKASSNGQRTDNDLGNTDSNESVCGSSFTGTDIVLYRTPSEIGKSYNFLQTNAIKIDRDVEACIHALQSKMERYKLDV